VSRVDELSMFLQRFVPPEAHARIVLRRLRALLPADARTDPDALKAILWEFAHSREQVFFVQIGSNDGQQMDPLQPYVAGPGWSGLMVEPQPAAFERLARLHAGHPRIALERAAISDHDGYQTLYVVAASGGEPNFYDLYASFRREVLLKHEVFVPDIARRIEEVEVPCFTFDSLCRRHGVSRIDLLHTDTEGYDWEILAQVDLERYRPALVIFEHVNLSPADRAQCLARFHSSGYETLALELDTICLDPTRAGARLLKLWRSRQAAAA
jgi:FkbM family methyltransferase